MWDALTFRTAATLRVIDNLSDEQLCWLRPGAVNSVGWLIWHIAEVEDNWIREKVLKLPKRYPFGTSAKAQPPDGVQGAPRGDV